MCSAPDPCVKHRVSGVTAFGTSKNKKQQTIGDEVERTSGGEKAGELVRGLRESFGSGKTRTYEWRAAQLKGIIRMIDEKEEDILVAVKGDLAKPKLEAFKEDTSLKLNALLGPKSQFWMCIWNCIH